MISSRVIAAGVAMLFEAFAGTGLWSPILFIAATIMRDLQNVAVPVPFMAVPVLLGLMGHMMNSVILGIVFALVVAPRVRERGPLVGVGIVYSLVVFVVMWFAVVPLVDPVMLKLNALLFAIAHMMWGAALGLILDWQDAPAMQPRTAH